MPQKNQWTITAYETHLESWLEGFLVDRKAANVAKGTLYFYQKKLQLFIQFCDAQAISRIEQVTPDVLRHYLLSLESRGHNPGGVHGCYRALKTFLIWYEQEAEPEGWKNPIRKVKAPRLGLEPLEPVSLEDVVKLIAACGSDVRGLRDKAIFSVLLDTGVRASELCAIDVKDLNAVTGAMLIRQGKGRKPRTVFLGRKSRQAIRAYLSHRKDNHPALWVTATERLSYWGLNEILKRRAKQAGIQKPELHAFRRAFALQMLRGGADIFTIQLLMGHADLQVLRRYLKQTDEDVQAAHAMASPLDNLGR